MNILRSSLVMAIVSLLVLGGYGLDLLGDCCAHRETPAEHSQSGSPTDDCSCLCHSSVPLLMAEGVGLQGTFSRKPDFAPAGNEFPPDAEPAGIDLPPQLG